MKAIIILLLIASISIASADKVWLDNELVYDSDSLIDQIKISTASVFGAATITQVYTGISRADFGQGGTDCVKYNTCWTAEMYKPNFPTYWNKYAVVPGKGSGYFFVQFSKQGGGESGQWTATSEKALFTALDTAGIDYSSFYTAPIITPSPTPTISPTISPTATPSPPPTSNIPLIAVPAIGLISISAYFLIRRKK